MSLLNRRALLTGALALLLAPKELAPGRKLWAMGWAPATPAASLVTVRPIEDWQGDMFLSFQWTAVGGKGPQVEGGTWVLGFRTLALGTRE